MCQRSVNKIIRTDLAKINSNLIFIFRKHALPGYDHILKGYGVFWFGYDHILKRYGVFWLGYDHILEGYDRIPERYGVFLFRYDDILKRYGVFQQRDEHILKKDSHFMVWIQYSLTQNKHWHKAA